MFNHRHVTDTELTHMPSRLVEIVSGESGDIVIRLNIEPSPDASYVALSYCWGHDQEYKTTSVNLDKQRHDISYLSLPKTLQDAINVMQKLGYKFIWIDSLCIIQDDEEDKNVEIARMPAVYSHAVVTIAASSAASVHEGFLNERGEASHANAVRVQVRDASQRTGRMILLWKVESEVGIEPLYDRGWALQERILSTRVLEFKSRQVRFHCSSSEAKPLADGWTFHPENHNSITPETIFTLIDLSNIGRVTWRKIVEVYSARKLGLSTDRPLAISGIAHKLARLDPHRFHTYVAGMWISELPFNLLWYCGDVEKCSRVPMQPSWSWTAINARVYMDAQVLEDPRIVQVEIISSHVELISELAPYGAVKNAELRIRGPLIRALCRRVANEPVGGIKIYDEDRNLVNPLCSPYLDAPECDFPTAEVEWPVCLLLVTQRVPDGPAYPMMGLILRLCGQTGERRWYSRVGMFISSCCSAGYAVAQLARMFAEVGEREQDIIELC